MKINLVKKIILFCLLAVLVSFFVYGLLGIFTPKDKRDDTQILFEIEKGENNIKIAKKLEKENLYNFFIIIYPKDFTAHQKIIFIYFFLSL